VNDGKVQAFTRNGNGWTGRYPGIVADAKKLRCRSAMVDGEVIVQDEAGLSDFRAGQDAIRWHPDRLVFFAFDLPNSNDEDLRDAGTCVQGRSNSDLIREDIRLSHEFAGAPQQLA
jgi:bifunctional non-homologous end joining protein LigD